MPSKKKTLRKHRILVLMHTDLIPPEDVKKLSEQEFLELKTEYDVLQGLRKLGHEARPLGLVDDLAPLRSAITEFKPHIVFNLLEEFHGSVLLDQNVVSYLELVQVPYTGCNPRGLMIARDKALSKKILHYHRIPVPRFQVVPKGRTLKRKPAALEYPLIVKSLYEEASLGIAEASVVTNDEKLVERVAFMHDKIGSDAILEQYIDGRELYVGVLGNHRLRVLPALELNIGKLRPDAPRIATRRAKWDPAYQQRRDAHAAAGHQARLPAARAERLRAHGFPPRRGQPSVLSRGESEPGHRPRGRTRRGGAARWPRLSGAARSGAARRARAALTLHYPFCARPRPLSADAASTAGRHGRSSAPRRACPCPRARW